MWDDMGLFQNWGPPLDPLCRLDQYPVENERLCLNPSRHSSLGQACEGLTVIGQDSKWMPKCWIMWVDVSPSTWLFRWHPTARNALYYEVCELFGWTCTENNSDWNHMPYYQCCAIYPHMLAVEQPTSSLQTWWLARPLVKWITLRHNTVTGCRKKKFSGREASNGLPASLACLPASAWVPKLRISPNQAAAFSWPKDLTEG